MPRRESRTIRVGGYEFHVVGGPRPYLRMAAPPKGDPNGGYIGAVEGDKNIRKLRDYLTRRLRRCAKSQGREK